MSLSKGAKGECFKEDTPQTVEMDVIWPTNLESLTMYLFDSEAQGLIDGPHGGTHHACILKGGTHPTVATIILLTVDAIRSATAWA